jgi:energy-coupling factor transporter ATP-binding protein EcfA2
LAIEFEAVGGRAQMSISAIKLENLTVFEDFHCTFSPGVNVIIGENGTGKTHLLKVLYAFCRATARSLHLLLELRPLFNPGPAIKSILNRHPEKDVSLCIDVDGVDYSYGLSTYKEMDGYIGVGNIVTQQIFSTFIPAKEMLSISNITRIDERFDKELAIDKSLVHIIKKAQNMKLSDPPELARKIAPKLEAIMGGTVFVKEGDNTFWIRKENGDEILFAMEAEGIRKFGLLWQLLMNGSIASGTVLFWDEPEANLNPKLIPVVVDVLLELARNGVQIFLATHEYNLMKYFSVKKSGQDNVSFISLYKTEKGVASEVEDDYTALTHNAIVDADIKLLEDDIEGVLGSAD